jgi:XTP/dITP diphosphohydrolase
VEPRLFSGVLEGAIGRVERGANGFGYDPIFLVPGRERTVAEMSSAEKNAISHRGQAIRALVAYLSGRALG